MQLAGTMTALVTPFKDGEVDEHALRALVNRQIEGGVSGLVPCGTTGESVTLVGDEHARVIKTVVDETKGRVPVIAGAGTVATSHTVELCKAAKQAGADAVLLVCPYYNKPTQAGIEAHFRHVLREVPMPAVLYNIPGRTGVDMSAETLARLSDVPDVLGIKEATNNILRAQEIAATCGDRFAILSGDDSLTVGMYAVGGRGVISVTSNVFPAEVCNVTSLCAEGKFAEAFAAHAHLLPVHNVMFVETNPGPAKYAMSLAGHLAPEVRLPLVWPTEGAQQKIRTTLEAAGLKP